MNTAIKALLLALPLTLISGLAQANTSAEGRWRLVSRGA